jgi:dTDP-4-dehydrorhamnose reductase
MDLLREVRPRAVINSAAYTRVDQAEVEPARCRAVNVDGVAYLVEACRAVDCPLVQISTDYVFGLGIGRTIPYRETDPPDPQGVYARTKFEGERHAAGWPKHYIVRTCGLYGRPGPTSSGNFVRTMLRLGSERDRLRVIDDQYVTPSYVPHVARAVRFLLETSAFGTYHIVNAGETTWFGFAQEIFRLAGIAIRLEPIATPEYGATAPRPAYSILDTTKYHALLGAPVMPSWKEGLEEYLGETGGVISAETRRRREDGEELY